MAKCALCHQAFPSRLKLVEHFSEAHSIARQRPRRSRVAEAIRKVTLEFHVPEVVTLDDQGEETSPAPTSRQPLSCPGCGTMFATPASLRDHHCTAEEEVRPKKQPVVCQYCGQRCKDRRGAAIHQAFCEKKLHGDSGSSFSSTVNKSTVMEKSVETLPKCPAEDCGAIFKTDGQLARHVEKHHMEEDLSIAKNALSSSKSLPPQVSTSEAKKKSAQPPLVTVTMKPHVGKTEGLQDLSLLVTPTKPIGESTELLGYDEGGYSSSNSECAKDSSTSITLEECRSLDSGFGIKRESVLYVAEDGTVLEAAEGRSQVESSGPAGVVREEEAYVIMVADSDGAKRRVSDGMWNCSYCQQCFESLNVLTAHVAEEHSSVEEVINTQIKTEPMDVDDDLNYEHTQRVKDSGGDDDDDDEDWEIVSLGRKRKSGIVCNIEKGKLEYKCYLCKRHFLSELSYQTHVRNRECKNKRFKLPRMFSCHFKQCDSTFFKLTELQRHWQIAHKYTMASKTLEFEDERAFTDWLIKEEEEHKVRFTCDVKRRKPHRSERLLVCHRFHHLRTAAARKNANREYSDRHNWVHKIQPCLCFARLKVYQQFSEETCDYTGKITAVYYYEHSHPKTGLREQQEEVLEHVLQRNKRNRNRQFQDLKGNDKLLHRQKLEKFARMAGKECRLTKNTKAMETSRRLKKEQDDSAITVRAEDPLVQVHHNLLGSDELFSSQVEMVLDGQFDMGPEALAEPVVTHLDNLPIFPSSKGNQSSYKTEVEEEEVEGEENSDHSERNERLVGEEEEGAEGSTVQAVLPASTEDWGKVFEMVRTRVAREGDASVKAAAALLLPYERVIELVSPGDQVPIFRQLWDLACPPSQEQESLDFEIMVIR